MTFWRRIWQRGQAGSLAACTALDVGTEFAKALVFEIDDARHGTIRGVGRQRQGLSHMQSGTVADIAAVVDNCSVALQEAEEMAGFRPSQVVIGIAGELVKGFTKKYGVHKLVYFEQFDDIENAISREKQLKNWNRAWKIRLIEELNPNWDDLYPGIAGA
jgi:cell division ATPase FtsA